MTDKRIRNTGRRTVSTPGFLTFLHRVFYFVDRAASRIEFLEQVSRSILEEIGCEVLEMRVLEAEKFYRCRVERSGSAVPLFTVEPLPIAPKGKRQPILAPMDSFERNCRAVFVGKFADRLPFPIEKKTGDRKILRWAAVFRLQADQRRLGLLIIQHRRRTDFRPTALKFCEEIAGVLGIALVHQRVLAALRERVKEETCLFNISKLIAQKGYELPEVLQGIADVVPPAWRHPDIASCRIVVDDRIFESPNFREGPSRQVAPITVGGDIRGRVEVVYAAERPTLDEGPFLEEERNLITIIAQQIRLLLEEKKAVEHHRRLQEQLRHADRLATIGQLAGGVAHELNEPLASVLGFAQLVLKNKDLPPSALGDLDRIKAAALHSREVIRKLLIFGRQLPTKLSRADMNKAVEEALSILGPHLQKENIKVKTRLATESPMLRADYSQLIQVIVNLVVNSLQAMLQGGILTVETRLNPTEVLLIVRDTGVGMDAATMEKIFEPFFTTKGIQQGTGLGLSVVHGIVTSHGGTIQVESESGRGARFIVRFPRDLVSETEKDGPP